MIFNYCFQASLVYGVTSPGWNAVNVTIIGKVLQVNQMLVPDQKSTLEMSVGLF